MKKSFQGRPEIEVDARACSAYVEECKYISRHIARVSRKFGTFGATTFPNFLDARRRHAQQHNGTFRRDSNAIFETKRFVTRLLLLC